MEKRSHKWTWLWYVLAGALIVTDQVVKGLVRATIELGETRPFLPGFLELYHVENTGGAFAIFENYTWALTLLSAAVTVALALCIWKGRMADGAFSRLCLTLVLAGAAGNLIDRVAAGKVTDMFNFTFMKFGVFNVADICVVCGILGYVAWLLFTQFKSGKEDSEDANEADADSAQ